ncbi:ketopantoate reductase family protein [Paenibacillus sp. 1781tsa1]|uniref:ketopantoate reductase family protein n=1 Tax=Paenibacillus sp. 1781tsa1 TaxID=2953810 RepID=UPI0020A110DA|nr:2-dehydropantoate 2-reductase [Paenibacillus sp. 1781tsa1]MCP1185747.1 2-dehydropantoate 2-reductase [Paenibacillus sp. 1781tsa1]
MIIDIVGAGALGLLYGGKLLLTGNQVRFWTRTTAQADLLSHDGVTLVERDKEIHILPDQIQAKPICELPDTWKNTPGEWLLLMVKQTGIDDFIHEISPLQDHMLNIACFQNGMGHLEKLHAAMPNSLLCSAVTTEGAKRSQRQVTRAGAGETRLGSRNIHIEASISIEEERIFTLSRLLEQAGFDCTVSNEIDKLIYRKLLINAVINPLTALWRIPNGELIITEERKRLMRQLYDEVLLVYSERGICLDQDMWDQLILVCRSTATNTSSMLADVLAGRGTEVGSINGHIVRMAQKSGLAAPTHELLLHLIEGMQTEGVN